MRLSARRSRPGSPGRDRRRAAGRGGDACGSILSTAVDDGATARGADGLGGVAVDHFPAGTKFQRLDVPTDSGVPSIDIPLYVQDSEGRYRKQSGTMKFLYGYVVATAGTRRTGWMAYDALSSTRGCP